MESVGHIMHPPIMQSVASPHSAGVAHHPRKVKNLKNLQIHNERLSLNEEAKMVYNSDVNGGINSKTPVSVLQELLCRRGMTPKYELLQIEGAIHEPVFRYRVFLNSDLVATGTGRSKKDAKHAAAKNLLDLLVGKVTLEQANQTNGTSGGTDITAQVVSPFDDKVMGNPIGWLQETCMSHRWPPPLYEMIHEEGLPHERQFTIACQVLKLREVGTGKSKKLAKRVAAHKMWQSVQKGPPEGHDLYPGCGECDDDMPGTINNVSLRYSGLKESKISYLSTQESQKVSQFHKALKQSAGKALNDLQNVNLASNDFNFVNFLNMIAEEQHFEVTYVNIEEKSISGKWQCLVQLSSLPVAVCYGSGHSIKEAHAEAAHNALQYLKIITEK